MVEAIRVVGAKIIVIHLLSDGTDVGVVQRPAKDRPSRPKDDNSQNSRGFIVLILFHILNHYIIFLTIFNLKYLLQRDFVNFAFELYLR